MCSKDVEKIADQELPVPLVWRAKLKQIANRLIAGDTSSLPGVKPIDLDTFEIGYSNVRNYPDKIIPLQDVTWQSSIYVWMDTYWQVLVDLTSEDGCTSDLVLHVRVYQIEDQYEFDVGLTYVP